MVNRLGRNALPGYLCSLIKEAEERSGFAIAWSEECPIGYDAETRFARPGSPLHEIVFSPQYREYALHFLTSGALKISRFWSLPPEERYVPATDLGRSLSAMMQLQLSRKLPEYPSGSLGDLGNFLFHGILRQLISMPGDIRVEHEIAACFPEHSTEQQAYLRRQVADLEITALPEMALVCPERLYRASTAMNYVLCQEAATLADAPLPDGFRSSQHRDLGERLHHLLHSVDEQGYRGDRIVTDAWARELRMEDWYMWTLLE